MGYVLSKIGSLISDSFLEAFRDSPVDIPRDRRTIVTSIAAAQMRYVLVQPTLQSNTASTRPIFLANRSSAANHNAWKHLAPNYPILTQPCLTSKVFPV